MAQDIDRWAFPAEAESVRSARRFVSSCLVDRVDAELLDELVLITSELATNAVVHAGTGFEVVVETDGVIRLEVVDGSAAPVVPRDPGDREEGGRGMRIVDAICDRWGVDDEAPGKRIWCEVDRPSP